MAEGRGAPHGVLLLVVLAVVLAVPVIIRERILQKYMPVIDIRRRDVLLLPLILVLIIRLISTKNSVSLVGFNLISGFSPDAIYRFGSSPAGVALGFLVIALLLNHRLFIKAKLQEGDD